MKLSNTLPHVKAHLINSIIRQSNITNYISAPYKRLWFPYTGFIILLVLLSLMGVFIPAQRPELLRCSFLLGTRATIKPSAVVFLQPSIQVKYEKHPRPRQQPSILYTLLRAPGPVQYNTLTSLL